ncbi:type VI secretion system baseplate subunit TssG [Aliikangiella coralliicola]|uniref:Type VI secretion system baseplate subunit TssG n=1 Tax=Aliikangiella coralliicola TaxID=2592383 RepID=A0A545UG88_9GAMM|nr:type VI secretion system baseplate subunit TssG [Aliikangiella coralliicola]TQV88494.1 hypothetical protein FLL46_08190 [Aliikangiella coralliicola]
MSTLQLRTDKDLCSEINSRLASFDLLALLRLLKLEGYSMNDIWFSSHDSLASQDRLIEKVSLNNERVFISINLGLLGVHSPLPSALYRQLDVASMQQKSLSLFLGFFDHLLITNYLGNLYPQINTELFRDWQSTNQNYLVLQNMRSKSTLFWLFQMVFPEFKIKVGCSSFPTSVTAEAIYLGTLILGDDSTFGGQKINELAARHIHLRLMHDDYQPNLNWAEEALRRVEELVFPLLDGLELCLKITMALGTHNHSLHLRPASSLGYETLQTTAKQAHTLCLHQGAVRLPKVKSMPDVIWGVPCRIQV